MNPAKRKKLEAAGWIVGDMAIFLNLTPKEIKSINKLYKKIS